MSPSSSGLTEDNFDFSEEITSPESFESFSSFSKSWADFDFLLEVFCMVSNVSSSSSASSPLVISVVEFQDFGF